MKLNEHYKAAIATAVMAIVAFCYGCNSTHKTLKSDTENSSRDSSLLQTATVVKNIDSSAVTEEYHAHFETGDSTLDNELTIVFDSVLRGNDTVVQAPVTIEQSGGITVINAGSRKIKSILSKNHSRQTSKDSTVYKQSTTAGLIKRDSSVTKDSGQVVTAKSTAIKSKEVEKKKVPVLGIVLLGVGLLLVLTAKKWLPIVKTFIS